MKGKTPQTAQQKIVSFLSRRKNPATKAQIVERTKLTPDTVQRVMYQMQRTGLVIRRGYVYTGKRGRPPVLYALT